MWADIVYAVYAEQGSNCFSYISSPNSCLIAEPMVVSTLGRICSEGEIQHMYPNGLKGPYPE